MHIYERQKESRASTSWFQLLIWGCNRHFLQCQFLTGKGRRLRALTTDSSIIGQWRYLWQSASLQYGLCQWCCLGKGGSRSSLVDQKTMQSSSCRGFDNRVEASPSFSIYWIYLLCGIFNHSSCNWLCVGSGVACCILGSHSREGANHFFARLR